MSEATETEASKPTGQSSWYMTIVERLFAIDPRSGAAFRIGIALIILCDLVNRSLSLRAHYTDEGIAPRAFVIEQMGDNLSWSLHMLGGGAASQAMMFIIAGLAAAGLLVGYRTRTMAAVSWVMLASLQARNPWITNAGDGLLRVMLFWMMLIPLGRVWSIDALRKPKDPDKRLLSVATAGIMIQLCVMYVMTAVSKWNPVWHSGVAMDRVANYVQYLKSTGYWLRDAPEVRRVLSIITPWAELILPLLVWIPLGTRWIRLGVIFAMIGFHVGIEMSLTTGLFQYVAVVSWLLFVPSVVWDSFPVIPRVLTRIRLRFAEPSVRLQMAMGWPLMTTTEPKWIRYRCIAAQVVAGLLIVWLMVWSVRIARQDIGPRVNAPEVVVGLVDPLTGKPRENAVAVRDSDAFTEIPRDAVDRVVRLNSSWRMFAIPGRRDGYHVVIGTRADGTMVNMLEGGAFDPNTYKGPEVPSQIYSDHRWRKYFRTISEPGRDRLRQPLGEALCRWWHAAHPDDPLEEVEVDFIEQTMQEDGSLKLRRLVFLKVVCPRPGDVTAPRSDGGDGF